MNLFRRFRDVAFASILLLIPFLFLRANLRDPSEANEVDRALLTASAPLQWVATQIAQGFSSWIEDYVYLVEVQQDNERLRSENIRLRAEAARTRVVLRQNERMSRLLGLRDQLEGESLSARVIGKELSPFFRVIRVRLDRGGDERVEAGMAVVTPEGLVGQILRVEQRYSDVLLTADSASAVDVVVERTGARGILRGTGSEESFDSRVEYMLREAQVEVGDEVYTSGLGKRFPAGVKVGIVSAVEKREFGLHQTVKVSPSVEFGTLNEVLILTEGARMADLAKTKRTRRPRGSP